MESKELFSEGVIVLKFQKGDYVVHGNNGICQIEDITHLDITGSDKNKKYYILHSVRDKSSRIYSPVENEGSMRLVLSPAEAEDLINQIPKIEEMWIDNEKLRENIYKEAIASGDLRKLIGIIKTLYLRKQKRLGEGKKNTATDERYLTIAEDKLHRELAFAMGKEPEQMQQIIEERVHALEV